MTAIGISGNGGGARGHPRELAENARLAEELGFDLFSLSDTQCIKREVHASLALVADGTESIAVGPMMTNPVTRHPAVTASAICTLDEIAGGRAVLGMATGDSAVRTLGERPARLAELEAALELFRSLSRGEPAEHGGSTVRLEWVEGRDVPVYVAAEGPKTQRLAGRLADVAVIGTGLDPEVVGEAARNVSEGAREAGRDPGGVGTWVMARCNIDDDREDAVDALKPSLAGAAHHSLQFAAEGKGVPEEHREAVGTLLERYEADQHGERGSVNADLIDDLGLTGFLVDRYAVVGTPEECRERMAAVAGMDAVDGVFLSPPTGRKREVIGRMGREVLPALG